MNYFSIPTTALLIALTSSTAFAQTTDPQVACLAGTWVPELAPLKATLTALVDTPDVEFSGSILMVINQTNVMNGVEFQVDNWTLLRIYADKPDSGFTANGIAMLSLSAPQGGAFNLSEASNTYVQKLITPGPEGPINDPEIDLIREMLPMGLWAHGDWSCVDDTITFTIINEDTDGHLIETWYRQ